MTPEQFIRRIKECEEDPPYADYALCDFVEEFASTCPQISLYACEAVKNLYSTVTHNVLEAMYETVPEQFSIEVAVPWLSLGQHVGSAAVVAEFLVARLGMHPDVLFELLTDRLSSESNSSLIDRLAFACWILANRETVLIPSGKTVGFILSVHNDLVDPILSRSELSSYARRTLAACRR